MDAERVKKDVENYSDLLSRQEKLQKRLISLSGRDPDQEIAVLQHLEFVERKIEFIDHFIFEEGILADRESSILYNRVQGLTYQEISDSYLVTRERIRQILEMIYKKMAIQFKNKNIA